MQKRVVRFTLLALLLASGIAAAFLAWQAERQIQAAEAAHRSLETLIEQLSPAVSGIAAAQQAYVDYGQRDDASFARVSGFLDQIASGSVELRQRAQSADGAAALAAFTTALEAMREADSRARASLAAGETLTAADTLFGARDDVATMEATLRAVRDAESARYGVERAALLQRTWMPVAAAAALWAIGLMLLTPVPAVRVWAEPAPLPVVTPEPAMLPAVPQPAPTAPATVDLDAASLLCTQISRVTDTAALPRLLERAAAILDARGIILWMGAGDELFAVSAHGYDPSVMSRLRPIGRSADNATAAAWRTGETRTVAGDVTSHGAIVAPMYGSTGAVGVLAAEVRHGREEDAATRAVTAIIASQFATVLAAWPAPSVADAAPVAASDREAAVS